MGLRCRIRRDPGKLGLLSETAGEFELENASDGPIDIAHRFHVLSHLSFRVWNDDGQELPTTHYGWVFGSELEEQTLRLEPGEKYVHNVRFLHNVATKVLKKGRYRIVAVYH